MDAEMASYELHWAPNVPAARLPRGEVRGWVVVDALGLSAFMGRPAIGTRARLISRRYIGLRVMVENRRRKDTKFARHEAATGVYRLR